MHMVTSPEHRQSASKIRELMGAYKRAEILIKVGEYQSGTDPILDEAVQKWGQINQFLKQGQDDFIDLATTQTALTALSS